MKCNCTYEGERENSHTETWVVLSGICCSSNTGKSESPNEHLQTQKNRFKKDGIFIYVSVSMRYRDRYVNKILRKKKMVGGYIVGGGGFSLPNRVRDNQNTPSLASGDTTT